MNGCLVIFPGPRCEPFPHVLLAVVVRGESLAPQSLFSGTKNGVIAGREVWVVWRVTENLPLEFLQECRDCIGRMRPCIVVEQNGPTGELVWSFRFYRLAKDGQGVRVTLGIHCCPALQEVYQKEESWSKKNVSISFPELVWVVLDFSGSSDPGCFHWRLCRFDSGPKCSACCDQLKNARHFTIYFVYSSSCKPTPVSGSWKHPHKYLRKILASTFQGLL